MVADEISSQYKIKRFSSSADKDFITALSIYNHIVPMEIKTATNEITSFIDSGSHSEREMYFFGLYKDKEVVGYVECAYLFETKTIVIDYFILKEGQIYNSVFYPLYALLLQYFEKNNIDIAYKVVEVNMKPGNEVNIESKYLRNLLQAENFKIIQAPYPQPKLGNKNLESNIEMNLMISSAGTLNSLRSETYLEIVKDIYTNHYLDWYRFFMSDEEFSEYKQHVESLIIKLQNARLADTLNLTSSNNTCEFYGSSRCICIDTLNTAGHPSSNKDSSNFKSIVLISIIIFVITLFSIGIMLLLRYLNLNTEGTTALMSVLIPLVTGVATAVLTKKTQP